MTVGTSSTKETQSAGSQEPPEKNPDKYSSNVSKRGAGLHVFVESFFRDNIDRARERNTRYVPTFVRRGRKFNVMKPQGRANDLYAVRSSWKFI